MSIDNNAYLGPYIKATTEVETVEVSNCRKPADCPLRFLEKSEQPQFCPGCGLATNRVFAKSDEDKVRFYAPHETKDRLIQNNTGYTTPQEYKRDGKRYRDLAFMPNHKGFGHHLDECEDGALELTNVNTQAEIETFKAKYTKELKMVIDAFGVENVSVQWGLVRWAS